MKVLKFGGTSVGTVESLGNVKKIVCGLAEPAVIVVSALGGLTDKLIATADKAASNDTSYSEDIDSIYQRHYNIIDNVVPAQGQKKCREAVTELLDQLRNLYDGVNLIRHLPQQTLDNIVSFGERMSSIIVTAMIPNSSRRDALDIIKTEKWFGKNIADVPLTEKNIKENIKPTAGEPIIIGGFIATDRDSGEITNLGRGGSDYTAALIAAALNADLLEIWTDVDGFMTSDPRIIKDARIIDEMSFVESMELCSFGAKVVYPPTIYPVFHKNIPIKILNTFNPTAPGTLIKDFSDHELSGATRVRGLSILKDTSLIRIKGEIADNVAMISTRSFNALARQGITIFLVSQADDNSYFAFALKNSDTETALSLIKCEYAPEIISGKITEIDSTPGLSIVAVVGDNILKHGPVSPRIVNTLQRAGIELTAYSEGASKTTVTFALKAEDAEHALRLIHSLFFN